MQRGWRDGLRSVSLPSTGAFDRCGECWPPPSHAVRRGFAVWCAPPRTPPEAALVEGVQVIPVQTLRDCIGWAQGRWVPPPPPAHGPPAPEDTEALDEVRGHKAAKRALEVAAAGGHNLLVVGSLHP